METAIEQKLIGGKSFFLFDFHIDLFRSNILGNIFIIYKNIYAVNRISFTLYTVSVLGTVFNLLQ